MSMDRVTERKNSASGPSSSASALTDVGAIVRGFKAADIEAMERLLLESDFGLPATMDLVEMLEDGVRRGRLKSEDDLRRALRTGSPSCSRSPGDPGAIARAAVGAHRHSGGGGERRGKTTSIAKLARRLERAGRQGAAGRGRYLPRRRHRPARDLGRAARAALRHRARRAATPPRWRSTPSRRRNRGA